MKVVDRDKYEGQPFFDDGDINNDTDLITGKLLTLEGEHYGWYAIVKVPDSEKVVDYVDHNTFDTSRKLCAEYVIRRMKKDETEWSHINVWIPVKGVDSSTNDAFERAMGVVDEFR